jgi:hypothetical protein
MTQTAIRNQFTGTRLSTLLPWVILVTATIAGIVMYAAAATTTREARRAVGNGIGTYVSVDTTRNGVLTTVAWIVVAVGVLAWAILLYRLRTGRARLWVAATAAGAIAATGWWMVAEPLVAGDGFSDFERYSGTAAITDAMRSAGDRCAETSTPEASAEGMYRERLVCRLPSLADIRDGHDDITIDFFVDDDSRDRWTESVDHDDAFALLGPDWAITCEFQSTCAHLQNAIGGRNY